MENGYNIVIGNSALVPGEAHHNIILGDHAKLSKDNQSYQLVIGSINSWEMTPEEYNELRDILLRIMKIGEHNV